MRRGNPTGKEPGRPQKPCLTSAVVEGLAKIYARELPVALALDSDVRAALLYVGKLVTHCRSPDYQARQAAKSQNIQRMKKAALAAKG